MNYRVLIVLLYIFSLSANSVAQDEVPLLPQGTLNYMDFSVDESLIINIDSPKIVRPRLNIQLSGANEVSKQFSDFLLEQLTKFNQFYIRFSNESAQYNIRLFPKKNSTDFTFYERDKKIISSNISNTDFISRPYLLFNPINEFIKSTSGRTGDLGSLIAYTAKYKGSKTKNLYLSDTSKTFRILVDFGELILNPRFSFDGRQLIYIKTKPGVGAKIFVYDIFKKKSFEFFHNKNLISSAVLEYGNQSAIVSMASDFGNIDLYRVYKDKSKKTERLTSYSSIETSPDITQNGKLVYVSDRTGAPQIYLRESISGIDNRLNFIGKYNTEPKINATQGYIYFNSMISGNLKLFYYDYLNDSTKRIKIKASSNEQPSVSNNGHFILFVSNEIESNKLFFASSDGQFVEKFLSDDDQIIEGEPAFSSLTVYQYLR